MKAPIIFIALGLVGFTAIGADEPFTRIYDSVSPISEGSFTNTGWKLVPEDNVSHKFSGHPILTNDKLIVAVRGVGANVYLNTPKGMRHRAYLNYVDLDRRGGIFDSYQILENSSGGVMLKATLKNEAHTAIKFRLTTGEGILEIRSEATKGLMEMDTTSYYVIVPDYFGDDLVFGLEGFHAQPLPAENFFLQLLNDEDGMIMSVWQSREQEAWHTKMFRAADGLHCRTAVSCLEGKSLWFAFIETPGFWESGTTSNLWQESTLSAKSALPFPAKWRCSAVGKDGLADSWDLEKEPPAGTQEKSTLIYPIDRSAATPLTVTVPTDIMRNALGVGPCQYILSCEGMTAEGNPTPNDVMNWIEKQFEQKKEKKVADDIKERLEQMTIHIGEARTRITRYAEFAAQIGKLSGAKESEFGAILNDLDRFTAAGLVATATPARAKQLAGEVAALIGKENSANSSKTIGTQLRDIGAIQDRALARCRMGVRRLKQQGRAMPGTEMKETELAQQIHRLAEQMLQKEGPKK
jgi:hypothetical protein